MKYWRESSKWMELRAKTDRQLAALLDKRLDSGLRMAQEAVEVESPQLSARAYEAYREVERLLPFLGDACAADRRRLNCRFAQLARLLNQSALAACG